MKKILTILIISFSFLFCKAQQENISLLKYEALQHNIEHEKAELLVVNFWATTCATCVKELPHFVEVNNHYKDNPKFKMLLVSLDRAKDIERVKKFIKDKNITAEVVILDDNKRMNLWIPQFDADWEGEIPVTLFYRKGEKLKFNGGEMSKDELEKTVNQNIN